MFVQGQVAQRFKELTALQSVSENKIRSQKWGGQTYGEKYGKVDNEFVLTGCTKERIFYDQLTPIQCYLWPSRGPPNPEMD